MKPMARDETSRRFTTSPTLAEIETLAEEALATIPEALRQHVRGVVIRVEELPNEEIERLMGLESPFDLMGLYRGVPLHNRTVFDSGRLPNMIFLYRRSLLDYWCDSGEDLTHLIRHVMIHEIGHHFGFSDADMHRLEREAGN